MASEPAGQALCFFFGAVFFLEHRQLAQKRAKLARQQHNPTGLLSNVVITSPVPKLCKISRLRRATARTTCVVRGIMIRQHSSAVPARDNLVPKLGSTSSQARDNVVLKISARDNVVVPARASRRSKWIICGGCTENGSGRHDDVFFLESCNNQRLGEASTAHYLIAFGTMLSRTHLRDNVVPSRATRLSRDVRACG